MQDTSTPSGCGPTHKMGNRKKRRGKKHSQTYTLRENAGKPKRGDTPARRSAEELGMTYPDATCSHGLSHHFREIVYNSELFMCKQCGVAKWQPVTFTAAHAFAHSIQRNGLHKAYMMELDKHVWIKQLIRQVNSRRG